MQNLTREAIVDTLRDITKQHEATIDSCIQSLQKVKESKQVSESNLRMLTNVWRELDALRELFYLKLFNSLKRGNMVVD